MPVSHPVDYVEEDEDGGRDPHRPGVNVVHKSLLPSCQPDLHVLQRQTQNKVFAATFQVSSFKRVTGKKGKPSVFPDLLVPAGCFAGECHRSSPREVLVRASVRVPPPFHVLRSRHAEQADSVHAQVTGKGNALVMFKVVGLVGCTDT